MKGQPIPTALLPAGHDCSRTAMEFIALRQKLYRGSSKAKPGEVATEKAKCSRERREHLERTATP